MSRGHGSHACKLPRPVRQRVLQARNQAGGAPCRLGACGEEARGAWSPCSRCGAAGTSLIDQVGRAARARGGRPPAWGGGRGWACATVSEVEAMSLQTSRRPAGRQAGGRAVGRRQASRPRAGAADAGINCCLLSSRSLRTHLGRLLHHAVPRREEDVAASGARRFLPAACGRSASEPCE